MNVAQIRAHFDRYAPERDEWKRRNGYYHETLARLCQAVIPPSARVLELGCGTGDLLASVRPGLGVGIDVSGSMLRAARAKYPGLHFIQGDVGCLPLNGTFDYVILSDLVGHLSDIQSTLDGLRAVTHPGTRIIVTYYNFVWQPMLQLGVRLGLNMPQHQQNWLGMADIRNLLTLSDFVVQQEGVRVLVPRRVPLIGDWLNERLVNHPLLRWSALVQYFVARPMPETPADASLSCTVLIPCRNEAGNIAGAVERTPMMGSRTELIFVDGDSSDGTVERIEEEIVRWRGIKDIRLIHQVVRQSEAAATSGTPSDLMLSLGKGDAVRKGFAAATCDVLMILDADLTVPPEELPKFFKAIAQGKGRFINGTRLVYPLEDEAMKFFNMLGNKFFSWVFTWLLGQRIKDTLCGTKVLRKADYERIAAGRAYFGDFDPFGDFDLLFGAARLGLPLIEVPVRYRRRVFGDSKVRLIKHGILLLRMSWIGFLRLRLKIARG
jgi:SAM-dependent methyltransferase/glycosyltransferase involved in cell wall biosynthesis